MATFVEKPALWDDPYFEEMMKEAEFANMTFEEQEAYIASMKQRWDYKNSVDFAVQKEMQDVSRNMLADKMPIENVAKYTRLSIEQVKALL